MLLTTPTSHDRLELQVERSVFYVAITWLYLIASLGCGLDHWTELLDWMTGLTFELLNPSFPDEDGRRKTAWYTLFLQN